jgi:hypothetical protein
MVEENAYRLLVGKREKERLLAKPRSALKDNIKMQLRERVGGVDWTDLAEDRDQCRAVGFHKMSGG